MTTTRHLPAPPVSPASRGRVAPEVQVAPYVLIRMTAVDLPAARPAGRQLRHLQDQLVDRLVECRALGPELTDELYRLGGEVPPAYRRSVLLPLRRDVHNGRSPAGDLGARLGDLPGRLPALGRWLRARAEIDRLTGAIDTVRRMRAGLVEAVAALPPPARELRPADWYAHFGVRDSDQADAGHGADDGPELGWQPHGTVLEQPYRAEVDRYGGPDVISAAEDLFAASSRVAAALLAAPPARRRSTAVDLLFGFLTASDLTAHEAVRFLRGYANGWTLVPEAHGHDLGLALMAAERDFHADASAYPARQRLIADIVTHRKGASTSVNYWADEVAAYVARLRALEGQGRLHGTVPGVLASQLHMLHNRLGLSIPAECHLAWLASLAYGSPAAAPDFHADGIDAPDREYHERSKFVRTRWPDQRPRTVEPAPGRPGPDLPSGTATLDLPEPTPGALADTTLATALLARRTRYDFGRDETDAAELGRLLRYAAGDTTPAGSGQRRLAYPTPGALATTRLLVLPRRVASVRAALYEYLPQRHALQRVAPDPGTDRLSRVAPQFAPAGPDVVLGTAGLDVEAVPLWLFVVADLRRARARYGLRGYRFSAMEAGHLAQNLLLAAAALGLSAAPLGGFFDDELNHLLLLDGIDASVFYALALG